MCIASLRIFSARIHILQPKLIKLIREYYVNVASSNYAGSKGRVCNVHSSSNTSLGLSGFDIIAIIWLQQGVNVNSKFLNCITTAIKPCHDIVHYMPVVHLQCGFMAYITSYTTVVLVQYRNYYRVCIARVSLILMILGIQKYDSHTGWNDD